MYIIIYSIGVITGMVATCVAACVLAIDDLINYMEGCEESAQRKKKEDAENEEDR